MSDLVSKIPLKRPKWVTEFQSFIMRGNVIDLAVGVVIGAAFTAIVTSMVQDLFNPIFGILMGGIDFSNLFIVLFGERQASLELTRQGGASVLAIGSFFNAVIKFLIVGFAVFWLVKIINRLQASFAEEQKKTEPKAPTTTELLLTEIRDELKARRLPDA